MGIDYLFEYASLRNTTVPMLKEKPGEKEAQSLVEYVETRVGKEFDSKKDSLATREDLANVRSDVIK